LLSYSISLMNSSRSISTGSSLEESSLISSSRSNVPLVVRLDWLSKLDL
jgi:hypothetical protein